MAQQSRILDLIAEHFHQLYDFAMQLRVPLKVEQQSPTMSNIVSVVQKGAIYELFLALIRGIIQTERDHKIPEDLRVQVALGLDSCAPGELAHFGATIGKKVDDADEPGDLLRIPDAP